MFKRTLPVLLLTLALLVPGARPRAAGASPLVPRKADVGPQPAEYAFVVRADGSWTGEARLAEGLATTLGSMQARDTRRDARDALSLAGDDSRRIVEALLAAACADDRLAGPIALEVAGAVRAGDSFSIVLPGNPSTGYGWTVETTETALVSPAGDVETYPLSNGPGAPARYAIRFRAAGSGQARLRLLYRRPWEDRPPAQVASVRSENLDLSGVCAALSASLPAAAVELERPPAQPDEDSSDALLPSSFNWCQQGACTPIRDQGQCGSCWAFATVGVFESALLIKRDLATDLSEQALVSCSGYGNCSGGWWAHDYHISPGAVLESDFPYQAGNLPCGGPYNHPYRLSSWHYVGSDSGVPSVSAIKQAIYTYGPVAVALCAGNAFDAYAGGVFAINESSQCGGGVNHAVMLVGWNDADQTWVLRNSWGPSWGESGYMRIRWGVSNVGYGANYVVYTYVPPVTPTDWVYLPLVQRQQGSVSLLANGDFEKGPNGAWGEYSSNGWPLILSAANLPVPPHGGSWAAWLGGDDNETSILSQQVTIPASASALTYWYWIGSSDICGYDYARVRFGNAILRTYNLCSSTQTGGWAQAQIGLADWRGQTVTLQFVVTTDTTLTSSFFLDDVSISTAGTPAP